MELSHLWIRNKKERQTFSCHVFFSSENSVVASLNLCTVLCPCMYGKWIPLITYHYGIVVFVKIFLRFGHGIHLLAKLYLKTEP